MLLVNQATKKSDALIITTLNVIRTCLSQLIKWKTGIVP